MRRVGAQVVFDRLLVTDVDENTAEYTGMTAFMQRDEQSALQACIEAVLRFSGQTDFTTGIRAGDDEDTLFLVKLDIQRYYFLSMFGKESCNSGCTAIVQSNTCLFSKAGFNPVICSENNALARIKSISARNSYDSNTSGMDGRNRFGKLHKDADNLPSFVTLEFADAVVGFHYFGGFDEHGFTTGGFIVYDTFYFSLQGGATRNHQSSVAHGGGYVFIYDTFRLGIA